MSIEQLKHAIIDIGRRLDRRSLIAGTDGNISARLSSNRVLITASGCHKGCLSPEDIVVIDLDGRVVDDGPKPSSESAMHLAMYRGRADVMACVHAHPPYATAFAASGQTLDEDVLPEVVVFVGPVAHVNYAPPGTEAVPRSIEPFLEHHDCFLLANHGLLTIGRSLEEAYNRHETVEQFARITHLARQLGGLKRIPETDLQRLRRMRESFRQGKQPS